MSWKDKLENIELKITTGDGKVWKPLWRNTSREVEYNVDGFEAINIEGTYVNRKKKKGDKYPILWYFKGKNCIDDANAFEKSARDPRPWTYQHPFHGILKVQPTKLKFDYTGNNVVKITGVLWETISHKYPQSLIVPKNVVEVRAARAEITIKEIFINEVGTPTTDNLKKSISFTNMLYNILKKITHIQSEIAEVKQAFNMASNAAQSIIEDVTTYTDDIIDLINYPFIISQDVRFKIDNMVESIRELANIFLSNDKNILFYESHTAATFNTLARTAADAEYSNLDEITYAIDQISMIYDEVRANFDSISDFEPNPEIAANVDFLVNSTIANLYDMTSNARQKRTVILPFDDNMITLAHKYYGRGDDKLNDFIAQNNIGYDEYLQIKRGREIVYFV